MFHQKLICFSKTSEKNSSTDENYSSYCHFNPYFVWTSKWWPTKFLWVCYLDLPSLLVILNRQNRNEWVLSDLGNGDSNRLKLKARCTFLVATKIANNCLLHPRSPSISRDPSLQLSLLTVSCRYGASRARGLSWPQQSCYNTFTTLANFQQKSKELDHQSSGHSRPNNHWTIEITPVWPLLRYFTIPLWFLYYLINLLYMNGKLKYSRDKCNTTKTTKLVFSKFCVWPFQLLLVFLRLRMKFVKQDLFTWKRLLIS